MILTSETQYLTYQDLCDRMHLVNVQKLGLMTERQVLLSQLPENVSFSDQEVRQLPDNCRYQRYLDIDHSDYVHEHDQNNYLFYIINSQTYIVYMKDLILDSDELED